MDARWVAHSAVRSAELMDASTVARWADYLVASKDASSATRNLKE